MENDDKSPPASDEGDLSAVAVSLALAGASRQKADLFLEEHIRTMRREDRIRHRQLRIRHIGDLLKLSGEVFVALLVFLLAAAIATAMWNAAHERGLVVESFSVPPDLMQHGLTGQVVAARLLDRLIAMQNQTQSSRAASSYSNDWGNDIKVQIPDTGISLTEVYRYLRSWLGNETHITGDVFHQGAGIAVTARTSGSAGETFTGTGNDLDKLLQKTAEAVYAQTQPYRYAVYLTEHNRDGDAETVYRRLTLTGSATDRAWAYVGLANFQNDHGDPAGALALGRRALAIRPDFIMAIGNSAQWEGELDHEQAQHDAALKEIERENRGGEDDVVEDEPKKSVVRGFEKAESSELLGDFNTTIRSFRELEGSIADEHLQRNLEHAIGLLQCQLHDASEAARSVFAAQSKPGGVNALDEQLQLAIAGGDSEKRYETAKQAARMKPENNADGVSVSRDLWSDAAYAMALHGDVPGAETLIERTPPDCDVCARTRGRIAAMAHDWRAADRWFAMVAARSPSIPFANTEWGWSLLKRGRPDKAIEKFAAAHSEGPHFADPLEYWGEALMLENRSDLALARFEAADREAPNWGRLHLKWGEALLYTGRQQDARRQFAVAARLDLFPEERRQLARDKAKIAHAIGKT